NHNHRAIRPPKTLVAVVALLRSRKNSTVVQAAPTSTTNMMGLRASVRGLSFKKASPTARRTMAGSNMDAALRSRRSGGCSGGVGRGASMRVDMTLLEVPGEVLDDGAERHDREVDQSDDDDGHGQQQPEEQWGVGPKRAGGGGHDLLAHDPAADGEH